MDERSPKAEGQASGRDHSEMTMQETADPIRNSTTPAKLFHHW
jgi:hypothetical protein